MKKSKYYFNLPQICIDAEYDNTSILVLTYAQIRGYNSILALRSRNLLNNLFITQIPRKLYQKRFLGVSYNENVVSLYKLNHPQSFFHNIDFFYYKCSIKTKVDYIKTLSLRQHTDFKLYVSEDKVDPIFWNNPLLKRENGKIFFLPELKFNRQNLPQKTGDFIKWYHGQMQNKKQPEIEKKLKD